VLPDRLRHITATRERDYGKEESSSSTVLRKSFYRLILRARESAAMRASCSTPSTTA